MSDLAREQAERLLAALGRVERLYTSGTGRPAVDVARQDVGDERR